LLSHLPRIEHPGERVPQIRRLVSTGTGGLPRHLEDTVEPHTPRDTPTSSTPLPLVLRA
jgi:hypothetical protein